MVKAPDLLSQIPAGAVVTLDTAPIIYFLQDHPKFAPRFAPLFDAAERGDIQIVISAVTLAEVLTGPFQSGNEVLAGQYREVLTGSPGWQTWPVSEEIAVSAARFRALYKLRTPDAIQVATAVASLSHALITSDKALAKVGDILVLGPE
jgi:predicted nucleic acid-binding protein